MPEIGSVVQLAHPHHTLVVMLLLPPLTGHAVPALPQIGPVVYLVLPRDPLLVVMLLLPSPSCDEPHISLGAPCLPEHGQHLQVLIIPEGIKNVSCKLHSHVIKHTHRKKIGLDERWKLHRLGTVSHGTAHEWPLLGPTYTK